jgi:hypothetical protein
MNIGAAIPLAMSTEVWGSMRRMYQGTELPRNGTLGEFFSKWNSLAFGSGYGNQALSAERRNVETSTANHSLIWRPAYVGHIGGPPCKGVTCNMSIQDNRLRRTHSPLSSCS